MGAYTHDAAGGLLAKFRRLLRRITMVTRRAGQQVREVDLRMYPMAGNLFAADEMAFAKKEEPCICGSLSPMQGYALRFVWYSDNRLVTTSP